MEYNDEKVKKSSINQIKTKNVYALFYELVDRLRPERSFLNPKMMMVRESSN